MAPPLIEQLKAALGDSYRIERELGGGGMSRVFLATEVALARRVVIKVLPPDFAMEVSVERFRREIQLAAGLQHPHVVPVLTAGAGDRLLYFTMPFIEGESLRSRLEREHELPVPEAVRLLREVVDALGYAHRRGVVHRDIKPDNILLSGNHAVVTDFGVAKAITEAASPGGTITTLGLAVGTPAYMAPEQAAADPHIDHRVDIYAVGLIAYEMLVGGPPFHGNTPQQLAAARLTQPPDPVTRHRPSVPPALETFIARCLEPHPADRWQSAEEMGQALEGMLTPTGTTPTAGVEPAGATASSARAKRWRLGAGVALAVMAAGAGFFWPRSGGSAELDSNVLAVAPFDVLGAGLDLWREGLVDVLARSLDGAGPLRTVPPSAVMRGWSGRADAPSATALGKRTGAALAVYGQLLATGGDSVKLTATLYDVSAGQSLGEIEVRNRAASMDRLADSATVELLRALGRTRPVGVVRATALQSTTLPALKAFLRGEQLFRHGVYDSAMAAYQETVAIDSGFALAWRGMASVLGWTAIAGDSMAGVYALRAAALNHGLPLRDSLLLVADSLSTALYTASDDPDWHAHRDRLFQALETAARRYPQDAEVWYELGDASFHFNRPGRITDEQVLQLFDRAIGLDSALGESYIHAVWLGYKLGGPELGERYRLPFARHVAAAGRGAAATFLDRLNTDPPPTTEQLDSLLQGADTRQVASLDFIVQGWADSAETAIRVARALAEAPKSGSPVHDHPEFAKMVLGHNLAFRGHLSEAFGETGVIHNLSTDMAVLGGVPDTVAGRLFAQWLKSPPFYEPGSPVPSGFNLEFFNALPWWAARRDTASLSRFARLMAESGDLVGRDRQRWLGYGQQAAEAYLALARGDTVAATGRFRALPDTICECPYDRIVKSQLLLAAGDPNGAVAAFRGQRLRWLGTAVQGLWHLQRARASEAARKLDDARNDYQRVVDLWRHADPELQPYVTEAKAALSRLQRDR